MHTPPGAAGIGVSEDVEDVRALPILHQLPLVTQIGVSDVEDFRAGRLLPGNQHPAEDVVVAPGP